MEGPSQPTPTPEELPIVAPETSEKALEHIATPEEVLEQFKLLSGVENLPAPYKIESDEKGVFILYVKIEGVNPGDSTHYLYTRKGRHVIDGKSTSSGEDNICKMDYEGGEFSSADDVAFYNPETKQWQKKV